MIKHHVGPREKRDSVKGLCLLWKKSRGAVLAMKSVLVRHYIRSHGHDSHN